MTIKDAATASAIALRLELLGIPALAQVDQSETDSLMSPILARQRELSRRLAHRPCAADQRIQNFLDSYLEGAAETPQLPRSTFVLDQPGLARALSLPADSTSFVSDYVESYKVLGGVLHNPRNDRRTTAGVFHVAEGGLPIPDDKIAVDRDVFARLLAHAVDAPDDLLTLPWASTRAEPARCFVSLLLRPIVVPEVPGFSAERSMEIRFIAPGGLVSNLDFVEGIFGNGGDPYLPENDASLAPESWTGHTGCVVLAPHLTKLTKKELGLPSWEDATERQRRDGQCWKDENELYNGGKAFKCVARDERGVIVTVVADNYFGYCKKEVKTQIGYSANLFGCVEEEHAGGAIAYPRYNLGQEFTDVHTPEGLTLEHVVESNPGRFEVREDGSAVAVEDPTVVLVPGGARYSMRSQTIAWTRPDGGESSIRLLVGNTYVAPGGYRVHAKHREGDATQWHLVGTAPWSTQAHKPATVSGGGKSEISKSLLDAFVFGEAYVGDVDEDFDTVQRILDGNYADRFVDPANKSEHHRSILSERRSLGSVIKLLTPSSMYTDEYNAFLESIPDHIKELIFTVKRFYQPSWGKDWRSHFSVGIINGRKGNSLRLDGEVIKVNMLRVGFENDGAWRLLSLRPDFSPAAKVQTEDDITASIVAPGGLESTPDSELSRKFVANCESLLFQRPDDAIVRGYDKQTESDMSAPDADLFISNFQPLTPDDARAMAADAPGLSHFTEPMQNLVNRAAKLPKADDPAKETYWVCTANPRLVNGVPTKNPRYLQVRPDIANPKDVALADLSNHLFRDVPLDKPLRHSVDVVAAGRRNNPPEEGVPPLCAYNPLHYMELPELFMEFISSMTGKSPSTTGAGSEGALTKAPFNALPAIYDLNAALLSYALSGYDGWLSSAGYIGPKVKVAHDISLLIPEIFSRMSVEERNARNLVKRGFLEKIEDFEYEGRTVHASRLGYRMNRAFASTFFGRIFLHPDIVFTEEMLRPELQDEAIFADSVDVIVTTHKVVAEHYRADGSIEWAVPPLRALLEIMIDGVSREGWNLASPEFRAQFERENILNSAWYSERLDAKAARDARQAREAIEALARFYKGENNEEVIERLGLDERLAAARAWLEEVTSQAYRDHLVGSLGLQPSLA
ncbi:hypothetical protein A4H34_08060 [Peptidiphaga gingivicola]|uniref:PPi-type phosphoenolpyruvate carboxykinase lobe 2 domain-containing protein n=1 Tax=Peptidiphaga gingivicola TaxID=2741497 RepID=A0A179B1E8_9ACTO|nr:hypothetical protein [Peptidiphaga gingivicola]OAP85547.1 hypothetical protein A4H34_08060 [Peptidiphaga gingivicola]